MKNVRPNNATQPRATTITLFTLLVLILAGTTAHLVITWQVATHPANLTCPVPTLPPSLPCAALPLKFIEQEPRCVNELLIAMNVTNVHIYPGNDLDLHRYSRPGELG